MSWSLRPSPGTQVRAGGEEPGSHPPIGLALAREADCGEGGPRGLPCPWGGLLWPRGGGPCPGPEEGVSCPGLEEGGPCPGPRGEPALRGSGGAALDRGCVGCPGLWGPALAQRGIGGGPAPAQRPAPAALFLPCSPARRARVRRRPASQPCSWKSSISALHPPPLLDHISCLLDNEASGDRRGLSLVRALSVGPASIKAASDPGGAAGGGWAAFKPLDLFRPEL